MIWGGRRKSRKKILEALLREKQILEATLREKNIISRKQFRGKKIYVEKLLHPPKSLMIDP